MGPATSKACYFRVFYLADSDLGRNKVRLGAEKESSEFSPHASACLYQTCSEAHIVCLGFMLGPWRFIHTQMGPLWAGPPEHRPERLMRLLPKLSALLHFRVCWRHTSNFSRMRNTAAVVDETALIPTPLAQVSLLVSNSHLPKRAPSICT